MWTMITRLRHLKLMTPLHYSFFFRIFAFGGGQGMKFPITFIPRYFTCHLFRISCPGLKWFYILIPSRYPHPVIPLEYPNHIPRRISCPPLKWFKGILKFIFRFFLSTDIKTRTYYKIHHDFRFFKVQNRQKSEIGHRQSPKMDTRFPEMSTRFPKMDTRFPEMSTLFPKWVFRNQFPFRKPGNPFRKQCNPFGKLSPPFGKQGTPFFHKLKSYKNLVPHSGNRVLILGYSFR